MVSYFRPESFHSSVAAVLGRRILSLLLLGVLMPGWAPANGQTENDRETGTLPPAMSAPEFKVGTKLGASRVPPKYDVSKIGDRPIGSGVNFYSLEREQQIGKQLAEVVERESRLVRDPVITEYVNRIGQNLVRNSDAKVPFTIKVIDSDEVNAFALPGGFFFVNSGLILAADDEAELAGVMAHEIAHVAARHATRNATKGQIWDLLSVPMVFFGGPIGMAVSQVQNIAQPMSFLKFSRDAEREADLLGLEYQYQAGYDPAAFVQFFEKLQAREKKKQSVFAQAFATHPMTADRVKRAEKEIQELLPAKDSYVVNTSEFETVKARLAAHANHAPTLRDSSKPVLHRPPAGGSGGGSNDDPNRPTLRRRTDSHPAGQSPSDSDSKEQK